jgi:HK97 family phage prohead protease
MMKIEVREDSVIISGYVNAIERFSKPIRETLHGKIRTFVERIKAGVFKTALKRNDNVLVLLNHEHDRVLANTKDGSAKLEEDNIGLRAEVTITDKEVVEKARNNQLVGWSFGFYANSDELGTEGNNETRTVTDLDLIEVSILDDTKSPAYYGTSIEARSENERMLEYRATVDEPEVEVDPVEETETEKRAKEIELFAEVVANKVLEKLNSTRTEVEPEAEETPADEPPTEEPAEETPADPEEDEKRAVDYSDFIRRIAELN